MSKKYEDLVKKHDAWNKEDYETALREWKPLALDFILSLNPTQYTCPTSTCPILDFIKNFHDFIKDNVDKINDEEKETGKYEI